MWDLSYFHGKNHKCRREDCGLESSGILHARGESWRVDRDGVGGGGMVDEGSKHEEWGTGKKKSMLSGGNSISLSIPSAVFLPAFLIASIQVGSVHKFLLCSHFYTRAPMMWWGMGEGKHATVLWGGLSLFLSLCPQAMPFSSASQSSLLGEARWLEWAGARYFPPPRSLRLQ